MIDIHCHLGEFKNFDKIALFCERLGIKTISMTNRPSEFKSIFFKTKKYKYVRAALGLHPMEVPFAKKELALFDEYKNLTSYIGEIGLDFSTEFIRKKDKQLQVFNFVLNSIKNENKILSLHSRKAEKIVLDNLIKNQIKTAIFHWYSGPLELVDEIIKNGYYFSINPRMTFSANGKKIIGKIPQNRVLVESDSPFVKINSKYSDPSIVGIVYKFLARLWKTDFKSVEDIINNNFKNILQSIK